MGGFFIKRKLDSVAGKDVLYRKVLHEVTPLYGDVVCNEEIVLTLQYIEQLLRKGQSVEFFVGEEL